MGWKHYEDALAFPVPLSPAQTGNPSLYVGDDQEAMTVDVRSPSFPSVNYEPIKI